MAYLYRIGAVILLALTLAMTWTPAKAAFPPVSATYYQFDGNTASQSGKYTSESSLAASVATWFPSAGGGSYCVMFGAFCEIHTSSGAYWGGSAISTFSSTSCPADSTLSGGSCVCTPPAVQNGANNGCVAPDDALCQGAALLDSTAFGNRDIEVSGKVSSGEACMPVAGSSAGKGCKIQFNRTISYQRGDTWFSQGTYSYPGATSSSCVTGGPLPTPAPTPCKGGYPGQVNGVAVCIPISKNTPTVTDTTVKGTTTTADGTETKETTSSTTCTNGSCNTTSSTTVTNSTGASTTTTSTTAQSKGEFCAKNPKSDECGEGGAFSGDCEAGFTFEGDAILGAIAKEIHDQNCLLNKATDEAMLYETERAKTGDQTGELPGNDTVNVGPSSFDSSDAIGGAACITDKTVTVWGKSIVLPFSTVCPVMGYLKTILLSISYLTAAGIVIGRKT